VKCNVVHYSWGALMINQYQGQGSQLGGLTVLSYFGECCMHWEFALIGVSQVHAGVVDAHASRLVTQMHLPHRGVPTSRLHFTILRHRSVGGGISALSNTTVRACRVAVLRSFRQCLPVSTSAHMHVLHGCLTEVALLG
jgi:hypothetical protein